VAAGTCTITADQSGNANYSAAAQATQSFGIAKASQTITFGATPTLTTGGTGTVSATSSAGLSVTFASTTPTICTVSGNTVSAVAAGTCKVTADQAGNVNFLAAAQAIQNIGVAAGGNAMNLLAGWNLVGNGVEAPITVSTTFNDASKVATIWKWVNSGTNAAITYPAWAFYTPSFADGGQAYAASKGYDFLALVSAGEGYWINAKADHSVNLPTASAVQSTSFNANGSRPLASGWSLIASGDAPTPASFNSGLSLTPPTAGSMPLNLTSMWTWDTKAVGWYFWAPSLANAGTLSSYLTSKAYLDFADIPNTPIGTLSPTTGFWVNVP
jgi:hypothetical protein